MLRRTVIICILAIVASNIAQSKEYKFIGQEYEPFNWIEDGRVKGGMIEVVRAACQKMGEKCNFDLFPMKRMSMMLESGRADAVLSLIKNADREKYSILSTPIIKSYISVHALKNSYPKK